MAAEGAAAGDVWDSGTGAMGDMEAGMDWETETAAAVDLVMGISSDADAGSACETGAVAVGDVETGAVCETVFGTVSGETGGLVTAIIGDTKAGVVWARGAERVGENADPVAGRELGDAEFSVTDHGLTTNGFFAATVGLGAESTAEPTLLAATVTDPETVEVPGTAPPAPEPAAVAVAVAGGLAAVPVGELNLGFWETICRPACSWITCPFPPGTCCTILILFWASRRM